MIAIENTRLCEEVQAHFHLGGLYSGRENIRPNARGILMFATWFADTVAVHYLPGYHGISSASSAASAIWPEG